MKEQLMIIGLDGLSWKFYLKLLNSHSISKLKKWSEKGYSSKLLSTVPPVTYLAIPSLITGKNPPNISNKLISGEKEIYNFSKEENKPFWDYGNKKLRSCIVNLRCTYPPRSLNGILVSGDLYTPSNEENYTYPPELKKEIPDFHKNLHKIEKKHNNKETYLKILKSDIKWKFSQFEKLLKKQKYDLSLFWDGNSDYLNHFFWYNKDYLKDYYNSVITLIDNVLKKSKPRNVILLSDHGFDSTYEYSFNINSWLADKGYIKQKGNKISKTIIKYINKIFYKLARNNNLIKKIGAKLTSNENQESPFSRKYPRIDYSKTIAQLDAGWWGIQLNHEILDKEEYIKIRSKLIKELRQIEFSDEGVFQEIWSSQELYNYEAYGKKCPDIYLLTKPKFRCNPPIGNNHFEKDVKKDVRPGHHYNSREGFLLAFGKDINNLNYTAKNSIMDVAPTILNRFNIDNNMEGDIIEELFKSEDGLELTTTRTREEMEIKKSVNKLFGKKDD